MKKQGARACTRRLLAAKDWMSRSCVRKGIASAFTGHSPVVRIARGEGEGQYVSIYGGKNGGGGGGGGGGGEWGVVGATRGGRR